MNKATYKTKGKTKTADKAPEHRLAFAYDHVKRVYSYRTRSGVWVDINRMDAYGLLWLRDRLGKSRRENDEGTLDPVLNAVNKEIDLRTARGELENHPQAEAAHA